MKNNNTLIEICDFEEVRLLEGLYFCAPVKDFPTYDDLREKICDIDNHILRVGTHVTDVYAFEVPHGHSYYMIHLYEDGHEARDFDLYPFFPLYNLAALYDSPKRMRT
jgi:hypothetical protein